MPIEYTYNQLAQKLMPHLARFSVSTSADGTVTARDLGTDEVFEAGSQRALLVELARSCETLDLGAFPTIGGRPVLIAEVVPQDNAWCWVVTYMDGQVQMSSLLYPEHEQALLALNDVYDAE